MDADAKEPVEKCQILGRKTQVRTRYSNAGQINRRSALCSSSKTKTNRKTFRNSNHV